MVDLKWAALAGAAVLGACAGGSGRAPDHARSAPMAQALLSADALMYARFDADDDLIITQTEIETGIAHEFARADQNRDGALSPIEFGVWSLAVLGGNQLPPYRLDFDRNVDNFITNEEFAAEIRARARDYDKDEDGVLKRAEFVRDLPHARARPAGPPSGMPGGEGQRRRPPGG